MGNAVQTPLEYPIVKNVPLDTVHFFAEINRPTVAVVVAISVNLGKKAIEHCYLVVQS